MAGTLHHRFPFLLLIVLSIICSYAYSEPYSPSASPPFHHNDKPLPRHNPPLTPQPHEKHSYFPGHQHPHDHMKPPTSPPHPLDFSHPSPPGKPRYPIKPPPREGNNGHHPKVVPLNPHVHIIPPAAPRDQNPKPAPNKYQPPPTPIDDHRPPFPRNPRTPPLHKMQIPTPFDHNTNKPIHHGTIAPPSHSPHFYKSPPPHDHHGGFYAAPPPKHL